MKDNGWTKAFWGNRNYQIENGALKIQKQVLDDDTIIIFAKNVKRTYRGYEFVNNNGESFFLGVHQVKPVESVKGDEYAIRIGKKYFKGDFKGLKTLAKSQETERKNVWYK